MGQNSVHIFLFCVIVITSVLVIPVYEIIAEKNSISREIQWCCAPDDILNYDDIYPWL